MKNTKENVLSVLYERIDLMHRLLKDFRETGAEELAKIYQGEISATGLAILLLEDEEFFIKYTES